VSGGTWDLFRYPGIRSDSDMYTMGYAFRPWARDEALGSGERILEYLRETAQEYDVDSHVRYRHRVVRASWDGDAALWTVEAEYDGETVTLTAGFLWACRGYYDYERGYEPDFPGRDEFQGPVVHPQHWPADLDWTGQDVVVIGSGATAVTVVPAMAGDAKHVTMLQRSPSYVLSLPQRDPFATRARRWLPDRLAHRAVRWKSILTQTVFYRVSRRWPGLMRRLVRKQNVALLPEGYDVDTHFTPRYDPWDQRMCFVPDADLFRAVRRGDVEVVTATIDRFDADGILLSGGRHLHADVVVMATGLQLSPFGGIEILVDGEKVDPSDRMTLPRPDARRRPQLRVHRRLHERVVDPQGRPGRRVHLPAARTSVGARLPQRRPRTRPGGGRDAVDGLPVRLRPSRPRPAAHQGDREPWRLRQSYVHDRRTIRRAPLDDGVLSFS